MNGSPSFEIIEANIEAVYVDKISESASSFVEGEKRVDPTREECALSAALDRYRAVETVSG